MESLKDMQLILKVDGKIAESNITEFEIFSNKILDGINTDLNTDKDFILAKDNIKDLKEVEIRIANAKQNGVMSMEEVAAVMTTIDKMSDRFRITRLDLEKKVKSEETRRKIEIVNAGIVKIAAYLAGSWVSHSFIVGASEIKAAIKNKRSLAKMEEAVATEADNQIITIQYAEQNFAENVQEIELSEKSFPGLFPDWKTIALNPNSHVLTTIQAREEKFKNDKREAEERAAAKKAEEERIAKEKADNKEKADKIEADRLAKIEADKLAEQEKQAEVKPEPQHEAVVEKQVAESQPATFKSPPTFTEPPPIADNPFTDPPDLSGVKPATSTISIVVEADKKDELTGVILTLIGVIGVNTGE